MLKRIAVTVCILPLTIAICYAAPYKVCFTPGENCTQYIVETIDGAKNNIRVQAYSFTSKPIVEAIINAQKRGVNVLILLDKSNVNSKYSVTNTLQHYKVPFLIDYKPRIAHNKVMIIDSSTVITGSFNFTKAAQMNNAENLLIITDKALAVDYLTNFNARLAESESLSDFCVHSNKCPAAGR